MPKLLRLGVLYALFSLLAGPVWAAQEVHQTTFEWGLTELTGAAGGNPATAAVPRFDDQGGARVLTEVKVELRGDISTGGDPNDNPPPPNPPTNTGYTTPGFVTNNAAQAQSFRVTLTAALFEAGLLPGSPASLTSAVPLVPGGVILQQQFYSNVPAGESRDWPPNTINGATTTQVITAPAELAQFIGAGNFGYSATTLTGFSIAGGGGNVVTSINTVARFEIKVTYTYEVAPMGTIGDYLWEDSNRDGIQNEPPENGINAQNVFLLDCDGNLLRTTATANDSNGNPGFYLFDNLLPGCYQVEFTKPAGFVFTEPNQGGDPELDSDADPGTGRTGPIDLAPGEINLTVDAGVYLPVAPKLGDRVWEDLNGNGQQDSGEPGIPNATVQLFDCAGQLIDSTTTGPDGKYLFTEPHVVANGCYQVKFLPPTDYCEGAAFTDRQKPGVDLAFDSDAPLSDQITLTAPDNLVNLTVDAGVICPAAIGNYLWNDLNRDGIQNEDVDAGINGQQVSLLSCDLMPVADILGNPVGPQLTAEADDRNPDDLGPGYYLFQNLRPGCYVVEFTKPVGFVFTEPNQGGNSELDSDADRDTGQTGPIALLSGETDRTWDAGVFEAINPEIGDFIWEDKNGNGRQDPDEPGINGATVKLLDCQGNLVATTITATGLDGRKGHYLFTEPNVQVDGCYTVEFELPVAYCEGAKFTERQALGVDVALNSDAPVSDQILISAPDNLVNRDVDAGVICPAALGDYVWEDMNRDGIQNEGPQFGLNNVTVQLLSPGPDGVCATGNEDVLASTLTADDVNGNPGFYLFESLDPGAYCVQVIKPEGFRCTIPNEGPDQPSTVDSDFVPMLSDSAVCQTKDPVANPIVLQSGEIDTSWDAGMYRPAQIGDEVFEDLNGNGVRDADEPGVPGAVITITGPDGFTASATTGVNGSYLFSNLVPGNYTLTCQPPAGFTYTTPFDQGSTIDKDSNADPVTGSMGIHTLVSGESNLTIDCGLIRLEMEAGQGCTPGYWRQPHHFGNWTAPYAPSTPFGSVFKDAFPGRTLHDIVRLGGGGLNALGRHTVAALLNAANPDVSYDLTVDEVIAKFNAVYPSNPAQYEALKNEFEAFNEQGCPLGRAN